MNIIHSDMMLEEKVRLLDLKLITDDIYLKYLKDIQLRGADVNRFKYYKVYGEQPMFYSEQHLLNTPIEELKAKDKKNRKQFGVNRLFRMKLYSLMLRLGL